MNKWFEDKFEKRRIRSYAKKRINSRVSDNFERFSRRFSITTWLIIINTLVFIFSFFLRDKINLLALQADSFFSGNIWTLLTSMFMHAGAGHLLANMVSLFFVGNFVEKIIGRKKFIWLYILSGIFAGFFYVTLSHFFGITELGAKIFGSPEMFAVGASGAIFALAGLLAVLTPNLKVYLLTGPILAIIFQAIFVSFFPKSPYISILSLLITFYIVISLASIFLFNPKLTRITIPWKMPFWLLPIIAIVPLVIIGLFIPLPIGNTAHLGGLIIGLGYGFYLKKKYKRKTEMIKKYFSN